MLEQRCTGWGAGVPPHQRADLAVSAFMCPSLLCAKLSHKPAQGFISHLQRIRWTALDWGFTASPGSGSGTWGAEPRCPTAPAEIRLHCTPRLCRAALSLCSHRALRGALAAGSSPYLLYSLDGTRQATKMLQVSDGDLGSCSWDRPSITKMPMPRTAAVEGEKHSSYCLEGIKSVLHTVGKFLSPANLSLSLRHKICKAMKPGVWWCGNHIRDEHHQNCF